MPTLNEAAAAIDLLAQQGANQVQVHAWQQELEAATHQANSVAENFAQSREAEFIELRQAALEEGTALRDELEQLAATGQTGMRELEAYAGQYQQLQTQVRALRRKEEELQAIIERLKEVEYDPVAWVDSTFYRKYPSLGPRFTFL